MTAQPSPSATVVVIRDADDDLELLLLKRSPRADGQSGPWVFPGGKIEPRDRAEDGSDDLESRARSAGVRETSEEAGIALEPGRMITISRWITPEVAPRRFDTWFFLAPVHESAVVRVDGSEICEHRWLNPGAALDAHRGGAIRLAPPTFVTVSWLTVFRRANDALATLASRPVLTFRPQICRVEGGACILYPGDAGYEGADVDRPGPRHRLWSVSGELRYERAE